MPLTVEEQSLANETENTSREQGKRFERFGDTSLDYITVYNKDGEEYTDKGVIDDKRIS